MRCVQCDSEMEYIQGSESNDWKVNHWMCSECNYSETDGQRIDINLSEESYIPKKKR